MLEVHGYVINADIMLYNFAFSLHKVKLQIVLVSLSLSFFLFHTHPFTHSLIHSLSTDVIHAFGFTIIYFI